MTQQLNTALVPEWTLGDRLRKARETAGLEAIQLADEIGVHRQSVANYEKGKTKPRRIVLRAWAMRTGVSLDWLETGTASSPRGGGVSFSHSLEAGDTRTSSGRDTRRLSDLIAV